MPVYLYLCMCVFVRECAHTPCGGGCWSLSAERLGVAQEVAPPDRQPQRSELRAFSESVCFLSLPFRFSFNRFPLPGSRAGRRPWQGRHGASPPPSPQGFHPLASTPPVPCLGPTWTPHRPLSLSSLSTFPFPPFSQETLQVGSLPTGLLAGTGALLLYLCLPGDRSELQEAVCVAGSETSLGDALPGLWGLCLPGLPTPGALALTRHEWDNFEVKILRAWPLGVSRQASGAYSARAVLSGHLLLT